MRLRRASIDRKLDVLAAYTQNAKQRTIRRAIPAAIAIAATIAGVWVWKSRSARRRRPRRSLRVARAAAAFR